MTELNISSFEMDSNGWYTLPYNRKVKFGSENHIGKHVNLGSGIVFGGRVSVGNYTEIGDGARLDNLVRVGEWSIIGTGVSLAIRVEIGDNVEIQSGARIDMSAKIGSRVNVDYGVLVGSNVEIGDDSWIGAQAILGNRVRLGRGTRLGKRVMLSDNVVLGEGVSIEDGMTSEELNRFFIEIYRAQYGGSFRATKWVRTNRLSPLKKGRMIEYRKGAIVEEPDAKISDQQCAPGLHVYRYGHFPEWYGLSREGLIPITVEIRTEDLCFAGLPGNDGQLRVRRLKVLD